MNAQNHQDRVHTLKTIPLFSSLSEDDMAEVARLFDERTYRKGETICRAGEEGDTFYVILSGVLEVWGGKEGQMIGRLGSRDFFGELALVVGGPRSATVTVAQRAVLLSLTKENFQRFFHKNTKALEYFARIICQRLASTAAGYDERKRPITVVSIAGRPDLRGRTLVARSLAILLQRMQDGRVLLVRVRLTTDDAARADEPMLKDPQASLETIRRAVRPGREGLPDQLDLVMEPPSSAIGCGEELAEMVTKLSDDFTFLIFDLGDRRSVIDSIAEFTDRFIAVVDRVEHDEHTAAAAASVPTFRVVNLWNKTSTPTNICDCEPFLLRRDRLFTSTDLDALDQALAVRPMSPVSIAMHRMARKILGRTVGLALGGGAAFGLSHLGVLKVFEDNDIPIDMIAGCSMGSLVAIGYGTGLRASRLIELAGELGTQKRLVALALRDATFVQPGLMNGNGIKRTFLPFLGEKETFEDLLIPCRAVATDIENGERVALGSGYLADAFRASCSVPFVMAPVRLDNRILVDGGVADPVPAEIVHEMGADVCIAVNVVPAMKKGVETGVARVYRRVNAFNPFAYMSRSIDLPNVFDILMSSMQTLQHELGNFKAIKADVLINPDLSDFTWVDFYRDKELIDKGVQAAERSLTAIRRAISQST